MDTSHRAESAQTARWLAGSAGLLGAAWLVTLLLGEEIGMTRVYIASTLFVVGTVLFAKLSVSPARWERTVNGPEARRFVAVALGMSCLMLLAGAVILVGWVFRSAR